MANYSTLKASVQDVIKTNGNEEITGALLQQVLLAIINSLGTGYQFVGTATPSTNPGTPDQNVFYIATQVGSYSNFGAISISENDGICVLAYNGSWHKYDTGAARLSQLNEEELRLIKLAGIQTSHSNLQDGDIYYNYTAKQLRKRTGSGTAAYEVVPFYDGAIYTYANQLYIWNGTDLIQNYASPVYTANPDINSVIAFMYSDNLPQGSYFYQVTKSATATVISIRNSSGTTICRLSITGGEAEAGKLYEIPQYSNSGYNAYIIFTTARYSAANINVPILDVVYNIAYSGIIPLLLYADTSIKENSRCYVKNESGVPQIFIKGLEEGVADLGITLSTNNVNEILNLAAWRYVPNNSKVVRTEWQGHNTVTITATQSDIISAWFVKAVNNPDGDLVLAANQWSPTGGWHGYNAATSGSVSKTGRTVWVKVYADDIELASGEGRFCTTAKLQWCNRIQACNTEKADGSGREVIEEIITCTATEGMKLNVTVEAKALEDILIQHHYGLNTYNSASDPAYINGDVIFVGDNTVYDKSETGLNNKGVTSEDKNCNELLFRGARFSFSLKVDEHSCGSFKYCTQPTGGSGIYGNPQNKGMLRTIDAPTDSPIAFPQNSLIIVRGVYEAWMTKTSV